MCCLSKASSHFVVFVCENPDRKPSRKMKRRNEEAVVRALRQAQGPKGSDKRRATRNFINKTERYGIFLLHLHEVNSHLNY